MPAWNPFTLHLGSWGKVNAQVLKFRNPAAALKYQASTSIKPPHTHTHTACHISTVFPDQLCHQQYTCYRCNAVTSSQQCFLLSMPHTHTHITLPWSGLLQADKWARRSSHIWVMHIIRTINSNSISTILIM